jgi:AcrR family transcriptional regulator
MNGFERKKEQKKKAILQAALELFKLHGFKKVSISDIARAADVSQVTIYNHFGSKDGLIREVVKALLSRILDKAREIIREDKSFPEKLEAIIFDKTKIASEYQGELMRAAVRNDPEMQDWIESFWQEDVKQVTLDLLKEGKREGYVSPRQSEELFSLYLEILRRGVFASPDLINKIEPDVEVYRELNYLFIYGLMGKKD